MTAQSRADGALAELGAALNAALPDQLEAMVDPLLGAQRIALYGVGREGLMMKAFAMRLFHLGLDAHVVGDMTTPPLGGGDLLVVSAGPGAFSTVLALMAAAQADGARCLCVTATPQGAAAEAADLTVVLPAQTMADDRRRDGSVLPMGSLYEGVQFLFFELVILELRDRLGRSPDEMRARHTNLE